MRADLRDPLGQRWMTATSSADAGSSPLRMLDLSDEILQVIFGWAPGHVCASTFVCRRFEAMLQGAKRVSIDIPELAWGAEMQDGVSRSWGRADRRQQRRLERFGGKAYQRVLLKLRDPIALVPLLREFHPGALRCHAQPSPSFPKRSAAVSSVLSEPGSGFSTTTAPDLLSRVESLDLDACMNVLNVEDGTVLGAERLGVFHPHLDNINQDLVAHWSTTHSQWSHPLLPPIGRHAFGAEEGELMDGDKFWKFLLLNTLQACHNITRLCLSNNAIDSQAMMALRPTLAALVSSFSLSSLDLSYNKLRDEGASQVALMMREVADNARVSAGLRVLDVRGNEIGPTGGTCIITALHGACSLETLDLRDNRLPAETALLILRALLDRPAPPMRSVSGLPVFDMSKAGGERGCILCVREVAAAEAAMLSALFVGSQDMAPLAPVTSLAVLDLQNHRLKYGSVQYILPLLSASGCALSELRLRQEKGSRNLIGSIGMTMLATAMAAGPRLLQLRVLDLCNNRIGFEGLEALADVLHYQTRLQSLDLGGNQMDAEICFDCDNDPFGPYPWKKMVTLTTLESLRLNDNGLGWWSLTSLMALLRYLGPALHELDLSGNDLQESVMMGQLAHILAGCHQLLDTSTFVGPIASPGEVARPLPPLALNLSRRDDLFSELPPCISHTLLPSRHMRCLDLRGWRSTGTDLAALCQALSAMAAAHAAIHGHKDAIIERLDLGVWSPQDWSCLASLIMSDRYLETDESFKTLLGDFRSQLGSETARCWQGESRMRHPVKHELEKSSTPLHNASQSGPSCDAIYTTSCDAAVPKASAVHRLSHLSEAAFPGCNVQGGCRQNAVGLKVMTLRLRGYRMPNPECSGVFGYVYRSKQERKEGKRQAASERKRLHEELIPHIQVFMMAVSRVLTEPQGSWLQHLDLSRCYFGDEGAASLAACLVSAAQTHSASSGRSLIAGSAAFGPRGLLSLGLADNCISVAGANILAEGLARAHRVLQRLECLDLADNILKYEGALRLWRAARDLPALVCVDMQRSGIEHAFRHDLYAATRSACRSADILVL